MWTSLNGNQPGGEGGGPGTTDLFSNREISLLIELVEALPVLYAADKKSFKTIISREKAWKIIADKLNRTGTLLLVLLTMLRINSLNQQLMVLFLFSD